MLSIFVEILISMLILVPVFCVLDRIKFRNRKKTVLYFIFATYLAAVYLFVGMPTLQFMRLDLSLTLVPFLPMVDDIKNTILNIILFVPLGIMLPFLWKKYNTFKATLVFGFFMSMAIELLQILTYRATDINDIIANTLGAVIGYCLFRMAASVFLPVTTFALKKNDCAFVIQSVFAVMFFIQPYVANFYYTIT